MAKLKKGTTIDEEIVLTEADIPKSNYESDRAPGENDDETDGYEVGSRWFDVDKKEIYECVKADEGEAEWFFVRGYTDELVFYDEGYENIPVTGGWFFGTSSDSDVIKEDDYLYLRVEGLTSISFVFFSTANLIDFSNIETIKVDCMAEGLQDSNRYNTTIQVSTEKDGDSSSYEVKKEKTGSFSREVLSLDVSELDELYYLRVLVYTDQDGSTTPSRKEGQSEFYRIWGE